jgi:hypothetical protein
MLLRGVWEVSALFLRIKNEKIVRLRKQCANEMFSSPIMSIAEIYPTMVIVKMGMFPRIPQPECESFALHRHDWQGKHPDLIQYEIARGGKKLGE